MKGLSADLIKDETLQGYLAYADDIPVGWCNAADKKSYRQFDPFNPETDAFFQKNSADKTKSVTCFVIAPEYRGKGIAAALLQRVIQDAKNEGYAIVEAYAVIHKKRETFDFTGPVHLYKKMGFTEAARQSDHVIMQLEIFEERQK